MKPAVGHKCGYKGFDHRVCSNAAVRGGVCAKHLCTWCEKRGMLNYGPCCEPCFPLAHRKALAGATCAYFETSKSKESCDAPAKFMTRNNVFFCAKHRCQQCVDGLTMPRKMTNGTLMCNDCAQGRKGGRRRVTDNCTYLDADGQPCDQPATGGTAPARYCKAHRCRQCRPGRRMVVGGTKCSVCIHDDEPSLDDEHARCSYPKCPNVGALLAHGVYFCEQDACPDCGQRPKQQDKPLCAPCSDFRTQTREIVTDVEDGEMVPDEPPPPVVVEVAATQAKKRPREAKEEEEPAAKKPKPASSDLLEEYRRTQQRGMELKKQMQEAMAAEERELQLQQAAFAQKKAMMAQLLGGGGE